MQPTREQAIATGNRLKQLRGIRTKTGLAREIGVSYSAYCFYEAGLRNPSGHVKQKIADYYNMPVEAIFYTDK